jgi:two-component system, cell cycle response regulator CpdR
MARILLAEDDSSLRGFLTRALERAGHQVIDCENGDDAIDALEHGPYDLLLTDIVMACASCSSPASPPSP